MFLFIHFYFSILSTIHKRLDIFPRTFNQKYLAFLEEIYLTYANSASLSLFSKSLLKRKNHILYL